MPVGTGRLRMWGASSPGRLGAANSGFNLATTRAAPVTPEIIQRACGGRGAGLMICRDGGQPPRPRPGSRAPASGSAPHAPRARTWGRHMQASSSAAASGPGRSIVRRARSGTGGVPPVRARLAPLPGRLTPLHAAENGLQGNSLRYAAVGARRPLKKAGWRAALLLAS